MISLIMLIKINNDFMTKEQFFKISLKGGAININELEIDSNIAAQIIRIIMPVTDSRMPDGDNDNPQTNSVQNDNSGRIITVKQFMVNKHPKSDMERITCLAYYMTNYKKITTFKTIDLTHLNVEASQPKLSNPSATSRNAVSQQYLAAAGGGKKLITPRGEAIVDAMPDRSAVNEALKSYPLRGNKKKRKPGKGKK